MRSFRSLVCLSMLAFAISAAAQIPQAMNETTNTHWGGNNYLVGSVFYPDGSRVNVRMNIKLRSSIRGDSLSTTDDTGKFVFSGLGAGLYFLTIEDEKDFEPVNQSVEVIQNRSAIPQSYTLTIRLTERRKPSQKPSVVRVEDAGVSKKALALYDKAIVLSTANDHTGAVEQLKLAITEYPLFVNAYNELGVQYQKLNDLPRANDAFLSALKIKPDAFEPMLNRGIVLFRMNKHSEAETSLRGAIKLKDQSAIGHFYLGRTLAKLNIYDEAEKELKLSITIGGTQMNEAHRMLAMMYIDKDDRAKAATSLEMYLNLVPTAPDAEKLRDAIKQLKGQ